jgi:metal-responsive CopG/Arc/MetJ family transcriptional regulator
MEMHMGGDGVAVVPKAEKRTLDEQIRFRVEPALLQRLDAVCQETGRKRSDVLRRLVLAGLELHERETRGGKRR